MRHPALIERDAAVLPSAEVADWLQAHEPHFDEAAFGASVRFDGASHEPRGHGTRRRNERSNPDETQSQEDAVPS